MRNKNNRDKAHREYRAAVRAWKVQEPPLWRFIKHWKWAKAKPVKPHEKRWHNG